MHGMRSTRAYALRLAMTQRYIATSTWAMSMEAAVALSPLEAVAEAQICRSF